MSPTGLELPNSVDLTLTPTESIRPYPILSFAKKLFTFWKKSINLDIFKNRYSQYDFVCNNFRFISFEKLEWFEWYEIKDQNKGIQYLKLISILILIRCPENKSNKSPRCLISEANYSRTHLFQWLMWQQTYFTPVKMYFSLVTGLRIGSIGILGFMK